MIEDDSERELLQLLQNSGDPIAKVLYHISMRQLAMFELVQDTRRSLEALQKDFATVRKKQTRILLHLLEQEDTDEGKSSLLSVMAESVR